MLASLLTLVALLGLAAPLPEPQSTGRDFHVSHKGWNGLSDFSMLAQDLGCAVTVKRTLDWDALDGQDVLVVLHPETALDENNALAFLAAGGRMVLADDYGLGAGLLRRMGIIRTDAALPKGTSYYRDGQDLPIAVPVRGTSLGRATQELVANHSSYFSSSLPATYTFAASAALVIEATLGRGRMVALADPSVLINNMLQLPGNRDFAARLVVDVCRLQRDRLVILYGPFAQRGQTPAVLVGAPSVGGAADVPDNLNRAMGGANLHILQTLKQGRAALNMDVVVLLGLVFSVATLLLLLRYLPMPVPPQDGSFARPPRPVETGLFASIQRYAGGSGQAVAWGYIYPATMLREEVLARLQPLLLDVAVDPSIATLTAAQVRTAITAKVSPSAGTLAGTLWQELAVLTGLTRSRAASAHGGTVRISEKKLKRWYDQTIALFAELDRLGASDKKAS
jgi:hypothetical protein